MYYFEVLLILIYENKFHDLQDIWLEDFDSSTNKAYFSIFFKKLHQWCTKDIVIKNSFLRHIKLKAGNNWCLLIVNSHSSHINWKFIKIYEKNYINLSTFFLHSTHRLQPLDLKIFLPLFTAYSKQIDRIFNKSMGYTRLTKHNFWWIFK